METLFDVAIIGSGIAGSSLAAILGQLDWVPTALVYMKRFTIQELTCAGSTGGCSSSG